MKMGSDEWQNRNLRKTLNFLNAETDDVNTRHDYGEHLKKD